MKITDYPVFTIGHSNHSWNEFVKLLLRHRISAVADVRSSPYSRYATHFNHDQLRKVLEDIGIGYTFLGAELGGRPEDPYYYDSQGQVQYDLIAGTASFGDGLTEIIRQSNEKRVTLLCAEREPLECHRTLLVAKNLATRNVAIKHILVDGTLEPHVDSMFRLLNQFDLSYRDDIFRSEIDIIDYAIKRQTKKFAYVKNKRIARRFIERQS